MSPAVEIRKVIAKRLGSEMGRKGVKRALLEDESGLGGRVIDGYLKATRPIDLEELHRLCLPLRLNVFRLISKDFASVDLDFRRLTDRRRDLVFRIEDAFLKIRHFLPTPELPTDIKLPPDEFSGRYDLIAPLPHTIKTLKAEFGSDVLKVLDKLNLTVLSVSEDPNDFEACLLKARPAFAICVNREAAPARIRFSLLHELAHYLFHRDRSVPIDVDVLPPNLYAATLSEADIPEYVATKFAQYFLIPFEVAGRLCRDWGRWPECLDLDECRQLLNESRASVDVLTNALYDAANYPTRRVRYNDIKHHLGQNLHPPRDPGIRPFIAGKREAIDALLDRHSAEFSPQVLSEIREVFGG